jgi:hypothetical protein
VPAAMGSITALKCADKKPYKGTWGFSAILQKVHVQEKAYLWQPAVVSRGTLNSQQTFLSQSNLELSTNLFKAIAFNSACLLISMLHPKPLNGGQYAL